jgi:hypothetical protein
MGSGIHLLLTSSAVRTKSVDENMTLLGYCCDGYVCALRMNHVAGSHLLPAFPSHHHHHVPHGTT